MHNVLKRPLYGNIKVFGPDDTHLFNCSSKKANWYLERNLAEIIQQQPLIIKLTFTLNGPGRANDDFFLQKRENICVVCGSHSQLTRHHIVPFCYRKWFPAEYKNYASYDILPLCKNCHETYEYHSYNFKQQIVNELNIKIEKPSVHKNKAGAYATTLLKCGHKIPVERRNELLVKIKEYVGREITEEEIITLSQERVKYNKDNKVKTPSQCVVEKIDDLEAFVKRWRYHFLTHCQPKFLPNHWDPERPLEKARKRTK